MYIFAYMVCYLLPNFLKTSTHKKICVVSQLKYQLLYLNYFLNTYELFLGLLPILPRVEQKGRLRRRALEGEKGELQIGVDKLVESIDQKIEQLFWLRYHQNNLFFKRIFLCIDGFMFSANIYRKAHLLFFRD